MTCRLALLHYDSVSKSMVEWCWPADGEGRKIRPSDLEKYRKEYDIRYPCCLCADGSGREHQIPPVQLEWTFREQTELLNKLDSSVGDGIAAKEFHVLFKRCKKCKRVGARPAMNHHVCSGRVQK
ncbi:uncharacterized protein EDB91DRAFT_1083257 [Suillus paluster]|uniref:uncharacterized protein n=1 Tax=Suillus paluster TaxID=48578 RepID=UPI001B882EB8|nr:uncharacterized protein EDB91DRAFT_1083257 [Suillus paluster]KAG1736912.1 hypothetical protein EDB91DRAFT_1083257 [Suillus paluster]